MTEGSKRGGTVRVGVEQNRAGPVRDRHRRVEQTAEQRIVFNPLIVANLQNACDLSPLLVLSHDPTRCSGCMVAPMTLHSGLI